MTTVSSSISTASRHAVRPVPVATDIALHLAAKDGTDVPFSYWDVWYALLSDEDFDGDLNGLADDLRSTRRGFSWSDDTRRKLSHLRDLQHRLKQAGLGLSDILAAIPPALAKAEQRRAHGRIIKHNERSYELSEPMRVLPENRLYEAALFGDGALFPFRPNPITRGFEASSTGGGITRRMILGALPGNWTAKRLPPPSSPKQASSRKRSHACAA